MRGPFVLVLIRTWHCILKAILLDMQWYFTILVQISLKDEVSVQVFVHFQIMLFAFFMLLNVENYLCSLDTSPVSILWFANIFLQLAACIFIFLIVSFAEQKFFILMKFSLLILSLID